MDEFDEENKGLFSNKDEEDDLNFVTEDVDDLFDVSELLKRQVYDELNDGINADVDESFTGKEDRPNDLTGNEKKGKNKLGTPKSKMKYKLLKTAGITLSVFLAIVLFFGGTSAGRGVIYKLASHVILSYMNKGDAVETMENFTFEDMMSNLIRIAGEEQELLNSLSSGNVRKEEYVKNYLIFGIEEFDGASNTDSIMIASINTKDNSIKLTSLLRDSYVEIPGFKSNKLNSAYARGGITTLMKTIENNYKIRLNGYAHVNFDSFEKIIDLIGGITIELGSAEANYLNRTNYISNPSNRNVRAGMFTLNGNQALGYCRVRKVATVGGANNDYGRTVRQRRVLNAVFEKCKNMGVFELLMLMDDCLSLVTTNVKANDIQKAIEQFVENGMTTMDTIRIPVDGFFNDPIEYNGITYPIVLNWDANIKELYKFIYLDSEEEAESALDVNEGQ